MWHLANRERVEKETTFLTRAALEEETFATRTEMREARIYLRF